EALCHGWIAVRHVQIDQARSTADRRLHHAHHCSTQSFFERRKRCDATGALTQKSASTVLRQAFGAYHSRKKCLVSEILFDRSQCLLAGQKYRAHPRRGIVRRDEARLLKLHFQNCVSLIKLQRPCEVTQRQKK